MFFNKMYSDVPSLELSKFIKDHSLTSPGLLIQLQSPSPHTPQPQPLEDIVEEEEEEEIIDRETLMQELKVSRLCPTYPHFFILTPLLL